MAVASQSVSVYEWFQILSKQEKAMQEFRNKCHRLSPEGMCSYLDKVATADWAEIMEKVYTSKLKPKTTTLRFVEALCRGRIRSYSPEEKVEARRILRQIEAEIQGRKAA